MDTQDNLTDARSLLLKFNKVVKENPLLRERFIEGTYNWLQFYQALVFLDLREYVAKRSTRQAEEGGIKAMSIYLAPLLLLVSFVAFLKLIFMRNRVLIFSNDRVNSQHGGDFRMGKIYDFLASRKIKFTEVFYTTLNQRFTKNLRSRRRSAFYLQAVDTFSSLLIRLRLLGNNNLKAIHTLDLKDFGQNEVFIRRLLLKYDKRIYRSLFTIQVLTFILRLTGVRVLLTIDSVRRYNELVAACQRVGIKVYAFQHGQFTKYQVGWLLCSDRSDNIVKPDALIVWSNYWKNELSYFGTYFTDEEIIVGGSPHEKKQTYTRERVGLKKDNLINLLIPYEEGVPKEKIIDFILKIAVCNNVKIFFKVRPDKDKEEQCRSYHLDNKSFVNIVDDLESVLNKIDIVLGAQSTLLYEMVGYKKPVLIPDIDFDYTERMVKKGIADKLLLDSDVCVELFHASRLSKEERNRRRNLLFGDCPVVIEETLNQLVLGLI